MRIAYCVLAAALASSSAGAADLMVRKAPPAPAVVNWTGFYAGIHLGYGFGKITYYDPNFPAWSLSHRPDGVIGGGQVGFNYQAGAWVLGIEADASAANLTDTIVDTQPGFVGDRFAAKIDALGTISGRLGYAFGGTLVYAKGGAAFAHTHVDYLFGGGGFGPAALDITRWGWTAGGGVEQALWSNWSAKLEYNYLDFGRSGLVVFAPLPDGFVGSFAQDIHLVKLGLNYRFGL
jgi:outer membrane immunogenic protein